MRFDARLTIRVGKEETAIGNNNGGKQEATDHPERSQAATDQRKTRRAGEACMSIAQRAGACRHVYKTKDSIASCNQAPPYGVNFSPGGRQRGCNPTTMTGSIFTGPSTTDLRGRTIIHRPCSPAHVLPFIISIQFFFLQSHKVYWRPGTMQGLGITITKLMNCNHVGSHMPGQV